MTIESIIVSSSYIGIFILMILNGVFGVFPSSTIIYIVAGYFAFLGDLNPIAVIIVGGVGQLIGNIVLYEVARKKGLKYITKFKLFPEKEIKKIQVVFQRQGIWFLFLGKLINPIKIFIAIPAGISQVKRIIFIPIFLITSIMWAAIFTGIGFYVGKSYENFGIVGLVMYILAALIIGVFYKLMNSESILKEVEKIK